jgi:BirA family biotin operon repressor/biotin-[acetyl-CoA-carboxylase] ligase
MSARLRLPPGYRLIALERTDSTNEEAKRLARAGAADGTLVWAREQTAGRGRRGRSFHSPPGNLYVSLVMRPTCAPAEAAPLGMVAAVAVGEAAATVIERPSVVALKWPNDVLVRGRKVSGILIESAARGSDRLEWLILGIGVNVESFPEGVEFPATCLAREASMPLTVENVLGTLLHSLTAWLGVWRAKGFAPVREAWLARAWKMAEPIVARLEGETLEGCFAGLDENGVLLLDLADGTRRRIGAADVFAPPEPA